MLIILIFKYIMLEINFSIVNGRDGGSRTPTPFGTWF